jgi:phosphoglucomutase
MKVYSAVKGESLTNAEEKLKRFNEKVMEIINEKLA